MDSTCNSSRHHNASEPAVSVAVLFQVLLPPHKEAFIEEHAVHHPDPTAEVHSSEESLWDGNGPSGLIRWLQANLLPREALEFKVHFFQGSDRLTSK